MSPLPLLHYSMRGNVYVVYDMGKSAGGRSWVPSYDEAEAVGPVDWVFDIELEHR